MNLFSFTFHLKFVENYNPEDFINEFIEFLKSKDCKRIQSYVPTNILFKSETPLNVFGKNIENKFKDKIEFCLIEFFNFDEKNIFKFGNNEYFAKFKELVTGEKETDED